MSSVFIVIGLHNFAFGLNVTALSLSLNVLQIQIGFWSQCLYFVAFESGGCASFNRDLWNFQFTVTTSFPCFPQFLDQASTAYNAR